MPARLPRIHGYGFFTQVWEKKKFRPRPMLCDGDGPIGGYCKWARQFYPADWLAQASEQAG